MSWKTNLEAAKMAFTTGMKESRKTPRERLIDDLSGLSLEELTLEQIIVMHDLSKRLQLIDKEVVRIRNNVVFFFWIILLSFLFWAVFIFFGGLAALAFAS